MKTHILTLAAIAAFTTLAAADSPDAILKDYRTRATQATERLNETLEKQAATIITNLIRKGDTAGAETVTTQVKQKIAGEPITPPPHVAAAALFAQFDGARATALQPIQKASLSRLDGLLKISGGPKVDELATLTKAKKEIEAGFVGSAIDWLHAWTFHRAKTAAPDGKVTFNPDGTAVFISKTGNKTPGTWETAKTNSIKVTFPSDKWVATAKKTGVEVEGTTWTDTRYLIPAE